MLSWGHRGRRRHLSTIDCQQTHCGEETDSTYEGETARVSLRVVSNSKHTQARNDTHDGIRRTPDKGPKGVLLGRYQAPVIKMKVGEMVHSRAPWMALRIMRCVKFLAKAMQSTISPQSTMTMDRNLPVWHFYINQLPGNSQTMYAR